MTSRRAFLAGVIGAGLVIPARPARAQNESLESIERRVFDAINFQRVSADAEPLSWDPTLAAAARSHSRRMLDFNFFSHHDPEQGDLAARLDRLSIRWKRCAENIFRGSHFVDPVALAVIEWMYSPGHRANLLEPAYTTTGVGVWTRSGETFAITQQFVVYSTREEQSESKTSAGSGTHVLRPG